MKLIYVGELIRTPDAPDHMGIRQGLEWLGIDYKIVDPILNSPEEVVKQCNEFGADLIVHGNTDSLNNPIIPQIKTRQVFFMGDYQPNKEGYTNWKTWVENSKGIEHIFISNRDQLKMWQDDFGVPASFWPHGCYVPDKLVFDENYDRGLVFIGSRISGVYYKNRYDIINSIESLISDFHHVNENSVEGRNRIWKDMPKIYHSSKAVLDVSHYWEVDGYASGRYWYSAGLGGLSITKRFPGCEEFYPEGKKIYFDTPEEAKEKYEFYKGNKEIKIRAYEWNRQHHNYKKRFEEMFNILKIK